MNELNTKEYWGERFKTGDWDANGGEEQSKFFYNIALKLLPKWLETEIMKKGYSICDIGCAEGGGTEVLYNKFFNSEICGVDFAEEAIEKAQEKHKGITFETGDINEFECKQDILFSSNTLEHFRNPWHIVKGLMRGQQKYTILLLPFNEDHLISEHFAKFESHLIPLKVEEATLVYYDIIECTSMPNTYWTGEQILLVYANVMDEHLHEYTLGGLVDNTKAEQEHVHMMKLSKTIERLEDQNKQLSIEIKELKEVKETHEVAIEDLKHCSRHIEQEKVKLEEEKIKLEKDIIAYSEKYTEIYKDKVQVEERLEVLKLENKKIVEQSTKVKEEEFEELENQNNALKVSLNNLNNELKNFNDMLYLSNVRGEHLNNELWKIHSSTFWKVATKYYYVRDNTILKYPFKALRKIKRKLSKEEVYQPVASEIAATTLSAPIAYENKVLHEKDRSVFIFAGVAYYDIGGGQRSAQLAKTFYKMGYDVHYIYAYDSSEKQKFNLDLPVKAHMSIDALNAEYIKQNISKESFFIFEIPHDKFYPYLNQANLLGIPTVYEHIDNWETSLGGDWFHLDIYKDFLKQADVLVATAELLQEKLQETVAHEWPELNKKVYYFANAVDCELFESLLDHKQPKDLVKGEKTLLYYGSLWGEWFDWKLIFGVAHKFPSYTINLIGEYEGIIDKLGKIPSNVHFLGLKKQIELPAYLKHSDYAILPFETCEIGKYVSPLKIFEYICMNKVVLSTKLPDVESYPNVYYGDTAEEWIKILEAKPEPKQSIAEFINMHNWYNRCNALVEAVDLTKHYNHKISVIILNRNNKKVIFRCVESLIVNNKYNYEIIVVDNDSTDGSYEELVERYSDKIKVIKNQKNGCSSGRNVGVKHATGEYLVFLDSDQWVWGRSWLDKGLDILNKDKNIGAVGWAAGWFSEGSVGGPICDYLPNRGVEKNELYRMDVAYIGTGGMVVAKKLYEMIEGFDEYYDPTCYEDTDFALSIKYLGFDLAYCPYMTIFHLPHQTTNSGSKAHTELMNRNGAYFQEKWHKRNEEFLKVYLNN